MTTSPSYTSVVVTAGAGTVPMSTSGRKNGVSAATVTGTSVLVATLTFKVATSATITGLVGGRRYAFVIEAKSSAGTGDRSSVFHQSTSPAAPLALASISQTASTIAVQWNASIVAAGGAVVTTYTLYRNDGGTGAITSVAYTGSATSTTVSNLQPGRKYSFAVSATSSAGQGDRSAIMQQSTAPGAPTWSVPHSTHQTASSIALSWVVPTVTSGAPVERYAVYRDDGAGGSVASLVACDTRTWNTTT